MLAYFSSAKPSALLVRTPAKVLHNRINGDTEMKAETNVTRPARDFLTYGNEADLMKEPIRKYGWAL